MREIVQGELAHVRAEQPFLVSNAVRDFQRELSDRHPQQYRHDQIRGSGFANRDAYSRAHPDVRLVERSSVNLYPYFEAIRVPSRDELRERVAPQDAVTRLLIDTDAPANAISIAFAYDDACAGQFQEIYRLRPLWALYLAATNLSGRPLTLKSVEGEVEVPANVGYRPFAQRLTQENQQLRLPAAPVPHGATLLLPIATLLGPIAPITPVIFGETREDLPSGRGQLVTHEDLAPAYDDTSLIGPAIWPRLLTLLDGSAQSIHEFDLANLYTIDRFWEAGCCPHLFAYAPALHSFRYVGELFAHQPGCSQIEFIRVPSDVRILLVAELEREYTTIEDIRVNGVRWTSGVHLKQGDVLRLPVRPGDTVELAGYYTTPGVSFPDPWSRNAVIYEFIRLTH